MTDLLERQLTSDSETEHSKPDLNITPDIGVGKHEKKSSQNAALWIVPSSLSSFSNYTEKPIHDKNLNNTNNKNEILYTPNGTDVFPSNLRGKFKYIKYLKGGSGGVHVIQDEEGHLYTLKGTKNKDHMKAEILTDSLYSCLGIPVPLFAVYDHAPRLKKIEKTNASIFRLAIFIEKNKEADTQKIKSKVTKNFIVDAFLSNWDIVVGNYKNLILDKDDKLWRIDNGGALHYRPRGRIKTSYPKGIWDPHKVTDIENMLDPKNSPFVDANAYEYLDHHEKKRQAQALLKEQKNILDTLKKVSQAISISEIDLISEMICRRFDHLAELYGSEHNFTEPTQRIG